MKKIILSAIAVALTLVLASCEAGEASKAPELEKALLGQWQSNLEASGRYFNANHIFYSEAFGMLDSTQNWKITGANLQAGTITIHFDAEKKTDKGKMVAAEYSEYLKKDEKEQSGPATYTYKFSDDKQSITVYDDKGALKETLSRVGDLQVPATTSGRSGR